VVERNSDGGGADSGVDEMGETLDTVRAERDKLATSLAEMNRTMQQLRDRMGGDERSVRESERRRRKDAHKANVSIRTKTQLDELDKENKRLVAEVKRCEEAEEQVRELKEQIASKESMLRDRDAAVIAAEEEMSLLRSLIGSASSDRTSAIELEAKIRAAEKVTARVEGERDAAAAGHTREREANEAKVAALTAEIGAVRRSAGDASLLGEKLATAIAATARAEAACEAATLAAAKEREALEAKHAKVTADLEAARLAATEAAAAHIVELDALKDTSSNAKALLAAAEVETAKAALLRSQVDSVRSDAEAEVTRIHNLFLKEQERSVHFCSGLPRVGCTLYLHTVWGWSAPRLLPWPRLTLNVYSHRRRKGVQNLLMEFVGNIRVFSRVRPTSGESPALVRATSKLVVQARYERTPNVPTLQGRKRGCSLPQRSLAPSNSQIYGK
jgi:myosin heavy subunit